MLRKMAFAYCYKSVKIMTKLTGILMIIAQLLFIMAIVVQDTNLLICMGIITIYFQNAYYDCKRK